MKRLSRRKNWVFIFSMENNAEWSWGGKWGGGRQWEKSENKTWSKSSTQFLNSWPKPQAVTRVTGGWTEAKAGKEKSEVKQENLLLTLIWLCVWGLRQIPARHQLELHFPLDLRPPVRANGNSPRKGQPMAWVDDTTCHFPSGWHILQPSTSWLTRRALGRRLRLHLFPSRSAAPPLCTHCGPGTAFCSSLLLPHLIPSLPSIGCSLKPHHSFPRFSCGRHSTPQKSQPKCPSLRDLSDHLR